MNIRVQNVTKKIHNHSILSNINVEFSSGKITGLKGTNGSGKTMLMRVISGLILPSSGIVTYNEKILGKDMTFPSSLGLLLENPAFLDNYSGIRNLMLLASIQGKISEKEVHLAITKVGLDPHSKKSYKKYSLGMKQRLGIAATIMEQPDVVIFDEPTNALDGDGVQMFMKIAMEEKKRGAIVIISCHDSELLRDLSDEIYYMESGKIVGHDVYGTQFVGR